MSRYMPKKPNNRFNCLKSENVFKSGNTKVKTTKNRRFESLKEKKEKNVFMSTSERFGERESNSRFGGRESNSRFGGRESNYRFGRRESNSRIVKVKRVIDLKHVHLIEEEEEGEEIMVLQVIKWVIQQNGKKVL